MKNEMMPSTEILEMLVTLLKQHEEQLRELTAQLEVYKKRVEKIEAQLLDNAIPYFSVSGYASLRGVKHIDVGMAEEVDRYCTQLSNEQDISIRREEDAGYGTVNTYHPDILCAAFNNKVFLKSPKQKAKW